MLLMPNLVTELEAEVEVARAYLSEATRLLSSGGSASQMAHHREYARKSQELLSTLERTLTAARGDA